MEGTRTITQAELAEILRCFLFVTRRNCDGADFCWARSLSPEEAAETIFRVAREGGEPEYEAGAVYVDAYGEHWRYDGTMGAWFAFGSAEASAFAVPKRPLRKLMPEPGR